jgi:hypothetical protein
MPDDRRNYYYNINPARRNYNISRDDTSPSLENIPLPSEVNADLPSSNEDLIANSTRKKSSSFNFLNDMFKKLEAEDIILIALVILFAMEGEMDEILMVALVYILITGFQDRTRESA